MIGGGPSGSTLALRLAQLGRAVALIEKDRFPRRHVGESLTSGVLPLLDVAGLRVNAEAAGFLGPQPATVSWKGELKRFEPQDGGGYVVDRGLFDSVLVHAARESGVRVFQPAHIVDRTFADAWSIRLDSGETLTSKYLADAGGRSRVLSGPKIEYGTRTLAMYAYWLGVDPYHRDTLVEAGESEWYWGAPLPGGDFSAMVCMDAENAHPSLYPELMRGSRLLWPLLANAVCGEVRVCDATSFRDETPVTPHSIKVGEAAISIDPLSSQGVQTSIGTALHAAVVINTIMDRPDDAELAMDFYRKRLKDSAGFHARAAGQFYREQFDVCGSDFWRKRARVDDLRTATSRTPVQPDLRVQVSQRAVFVTVGIVNGSHIVREDGVELDGKWSAYVGEARVADLLRALDGSMTAMEVVRCWSRRISSAQSLQTLQWAWSEGLIERAF